MNIKCLKISTVNIDISAQQNFRALSSRRHSRGLMFTYILLNSICFIIIISRTSNCRASQALREMRKNMYCAKMSMFTVFYPRTVVPCLQLVPRNHKIHRHCFTGSWDEAQTWLRHFPNSFIGLTPLVTYARGPREVAKKIPLDRLLLETDAPYFIPRTVYMQILITLG